MTTDEMLKELADDCWTLDMWSEHPSGRVYYTAKICCGVQARGRYRADGDTVDEAIEKAYKEVKDKWGKV